MDCERNAPRGRNSTAIRAGTLRNRLPSRQARRPKLEFRPSSYHALSSNNTPRGRNSTAIRRRRMAPLAQQAPNRPYWAHIKEKAPRLLGENHAG
jgi:hypothetical protein